MKISDSSAEIMQLTIICLC